MVIRFGQVIANTATTQSPAAAEKMGYTPKNLAARAAFQNHIDEMVDTIQLNFKKSQDDLKYYASARATEFIVIAGSGTLLLLMASLWIAVRSIANPLKNVTQSVIRISEGAYDTIIPASARQDEISKLWGAVAILRDRAVEAKRLTEEKLELRLD